MAWVEKELAKEPGSSAAGGGAGLGAGGSGTFLESPPPKPNSLAAENFWGELGPIDPRTLETTFIRQSSGTSLIDRGLQ